MTVSAADGFSVIPLSAAAERLLAYLLLHRRASIPRKHLAFELCPDAPESESLARLRRHLHLLQRALPTPESERPWVLAERATVQWNAGADTWLDVEEFERLCLPLARLDASAAAGPTVDELARAVDLYADDLLVDSYEDWVLVERERLRGTLALALRRLAGLQTAAGDLRAAAAVSERLVRHDPLIEASHRLHMALRYLGGDRGAALSAYRTCERTLAEELSVAPMPDTVRLAEAIRRSDMPEGVLRLVQSDLPPGTDVAAILAPRVPNNLSSRLTAFVGRESDMASVRDLVTRHRLVSLVGPCGCGKTRLALEIALAIAEDPGTQTGAPSPPAVGDGIWWVDLATVGDGNMVQEAVAAVLGLTPEPGVETADMLERHLRSRSILIVLDDVDHRAEAAARLLPRLLGTAEGARILTTGREPLGIAGEATWPVRPLGLPPADHIDSPEALAAHDAPRLFLALARLCDPQFAVRPAEAPIVARICRRLDGLPLALELAAAQTRALGVAEIDRLLEDRFRLLVGGGHIAPAHHATMQAAMDWSHDLLSEPERRLFRRLAVFCGGWTLESATAVCSDTVLDARQVPMLQGSLVARSLVTFGRDANGGARRYRMLETVRDYAALHLAASGDAEETRARHLAHCLDLAVTASEALRGPDQSAWLARLETERANFDAALRWSIDGDRAEAGLRMAGALRRFWELRGHFAHGRRWLDRLLAVPELETSTAERADALRAAGSLAEEQGDYADAAIRYGQALDIRRALGDEAAAAALLSDMGNVADFQADYAAAASLHEEALAIRRRLGDARAIAISLNNLGNVAEFQGDYDRAHALYTESLEHMETQADRWVVSVILNNLGRLAMDIGLCDEAEERLGESLAIAREMGDRQGIAYALHNLGELARSLGQPGAARERQAESLTLSIELGNRQGVAASLEALALVEHDLGNRDRCARLLSFADALRAAIGAPVTANESEARSRTIESLRSELGIASFERAWDAGRRMSEAEATALALQGIARVATDTSRQGRQE